MNHACRILLFALLPALAWSAEPTAAKPPQIVLVGDSTVTDRIGWGSGFRRFVTDGATVTNAAQNGRSSKSFIAEGLWAKALALKGDYYLIQFGHNDEPGKGPDRETDPALRTALSTVIGALRPKAAPTGIRLRRLESNPNPSPSPRPIPSALEPAASPSPEAAPTSTEAAPIEPKPAPEAKE